MKNVIRIVIWSQTEIFRSNSEAQDAVTKSLFETVRILKTLGRYGKTKHRLQLLVALKNQRLANFVRRSIGQGYSASVLDH